MLRDCHGLLYPAGYSRVRVRVGFIQPWPYPYPQPGVGGLVAGRHVQTPREKPVNGQPKRCQTHRICRYVFLFVSYILTNHAGSRRPTTANEGQHRSTKAHSSQQRPTKANTGQPRPTQAHEVPQQPTTANEGQRSVFFSFLIVYSYYYETVPTPPLACKYEPGVGLLTTTNHPPSPPPPPHHQQHHQQPTTANEGQRWPPKANAGPRKPTAANDGQQRPTQVNEDKKGPNDRCVFVSFFIFYSYYYETAPTDFGGKPVPVPLKTRTLEHGYGFSGVRVRVALENPRVTRANP